MLNNSHQLERYSHHLFIYQSDRRSCLYSFPTRRSSDLRSVPLRVTRDDRMPLAGTLFAELVARGAPLRRSEEHTSELQSHSELVCRLLLEKKKYRQS